MRISRWHFCAFCAATLLAFGAFSALRVAWARDYSELTREVGEDYYAYDTAPVRPAIGALERVQLEADRMLAPEQASVWGRDGRLSPQDLTNTFYSMGPNGLSGFNVLDAEGYHDRYKCNLFVFELAYRAGLRVPLMGRGRGWGYLGPEDVTRQINHGFLTRGWGTIATHHTISELQHWTNLGYAFLVLGEGREGRSGHMGMVDEFHDVTHDGIGRITELDYSGWEANGDGAHYRRRTWMVSRFASIHLVELREPASDDEQCLTIGRSPPLPSDLDAPRYAEMLGLEQNVLRETPLD